MGERDQCIPQWHLAITSASVGKAVIVFHEHDVIPNQPVRGLRENLKISRYCDNLTTSFSCVGQQARVVENRGGFSVLVGKPDGMVSVVWCMCVCVYGMVKEFYDRLCGLVVTVSGYRYRGPGFDPRRYQIF